MSASVTVSPRRDQKSDAKAKVGAAKLKGFRRTDRVAGLRCHCGKLRLLDTARIVYVARDRYRHSAEACDPRDPPHPQLRDGTNDPARDPVNRAAARAVAAWPGLAPSAPVSAATPGLVTK